MSKKMRFNTSGVWADFLVESFLGKMTEEKARRRIEWIDWVIRGSLPAWQLKLRMRFPRSRFIAALFPRIEIIHKQLIANCGVETVIKIGGREVGRRKFNI